MEGNACYKFSTIRNYIEKTGAKPVALMVEVGVNVGEITLMMKSYFPAARLYGFEAVREYYEIACRRVAGLDGVRLFYRAMTSQHLYRDDLGTIRRPRPIGIGILKGAPEAGPGYQGGSIVLPWDDPAMTVPQVPFGYNRISEPVRPSTLDRAVRAILRKERAQEIDLMKMDCEACEHSSLGCAEPATLACIRYIVGEYHGIERFFGVMEGKLFRTHKVNLVGDRQGGSFFAERRDGERDGILRWDNTGARVPRPWLADRPIEWHVFDEQYVLPEDRCWHGLS